ncbi:WG repeat-containing protein [Pedobacter sp. PAMC26386]|nr:WG repeat-containing protein [Pedobacter sp. PAMC26386]
MKLRTLKILGSIILISTSVLFACNKSANLSPDLQKQQNLKLYPWLARTGKFGYCDGNGTLIIPPKFDQPSLFVGGYALQTIKGKAGTATQYEVIDAHGKVIIQAEYAFAKLLSRGNSTLLISQEIYNAWWQFWNWKILPDIYVVTSDDRGFFKVLKSKWKIHSLPDYKTLFSQKLLKGDHKNTYWKNIAIDVAGKSFIIMYDCYQLSPEKKIGTSFGPVDKILNDSTLLLLRGKSFQDVNGYIKVNMEGEAIDKISYTYQKNVTFNTSQGAKILVDNYYSQSQLIEPLDRTSVFKSNQGKVYFSSDFSKPLPVIVHDYKGVDGPNIPAARILENATLLKAIPGGKYFLVNTTGFADVKKVGERTILLDTSGNWNTLIPAYTDFQKMLPDGRLLFSKLSSMLVLYPDLSLLEMPMHDIVDYSQSSKYWYMGKDNETGKYGIYDAKKKLWQVKPKYDYIQNELTSGIAVYTVNSGGENGYCGLIDIRNDKLITAAIYDHIDADGLVTKTENGRKISFYLNINTGLVYREK